MSESFIRLTIGVKYCPEQTALDLTVRRPSRTLPPLATRPEQCYLVSAILGDLHIFQNGKIGALGRACAVRLRRTCVRDSAGHRALSGSGVPRLWAPRWPGPEANPWKQEERREL